MISLTFYLEPVGKARARTVVKGGKAWAYTPDKTAYAEALIKAQAISWLNKKGVKSFPIFEEGIPLRCGITFIRTRPKSIPRKVILPVKKPDIDNTAHLVLDALKGIIHHDDNQIVGLFLEKEYVKPGGLPRIEFNMWEALLGDQPVKESRRRVSSKRI